MTTDADHPTIKSIRALEAKLERATAKCREVEMYQRVYKHMKKRLKDQRALFDGAFPPTSILLLRSKCH